jgi:hypothetical protein
VEGVIIEEPFAGAVVGHLVEISRDVGHFLAVLVVALVLACQAAEVRCCLVGGHGTFVVSGDGRGVVVECREGLSSHVVVGGRHVVLGQDGCLF